MLTFFIIFKSCRRQGLFFCARCQPFEFFAFTRYAPASAFCDDAAIYTLSTARHDAVDAITLRCYAARQIAPL